MISPAQGNGSFVGRLERIRIAAHAAIERFFQHAHSAAEFASYALADELESRVLLSAYALNSVAYFGANVSGADPESTLVADSSGNLYGTALQGGTYGAGTVFEVPKGSTTPVMLASFNGVDGQYPDSTLAMDASGNLYGTAKQGGAGNDGTVFEIPKGTDTITALASFNGANGAMPEGDIAVDASGNIFGTTYNGGTDNQGTVFELAHGSGAVTTLESFIVSNGDLPVGGVTLDASGDLFGTTMDGGPNNAGTVFEIPSGSSTLTVRGSFSTSNGSLVMGAPAVDASGNIFGTTDAGGAQGGGTVYEIHAGSNSVSTLISFQSGTMGPDSEENPEAGLTLDAAGDLFGTASTGGSYGSGGTYGVGTVFEIAAGTSTATNIASFSGSNGAKPVGGVTLDASGDIYGTSYAGGANGDGTVYEIASGSTQISSFTSFDALGSSPQNAGVALDANGDLFGTTYQGGADNDGTVYEIPSGSAIMTTLASFTGVNGMEPQGGLTLDAAGNLYGTATDGGASNHGVIFEVLKGSDAITDLASFDESNGAGPESGVTMDSAGDLYGTTYSGGGWNVGVVFELPAGSSTITSLVSFDRNNGENPISGVIVDSSGNLYGAAPLGGYQNYGSIFEVANGSDTITTIGSFANSSGISASGFHPYGNLAMDASGNLYGTTITGGGSGGDGGVFEIAKGSSTVTAFALFNGANGASPSAGVTFDAWGNMYGTTSSGGADGDGTVFKIPYGSNTITTLATFDGNNGKSPDADLTLDRQGNLYGTTEAGGVIGEGTLFELVANTSVTLAQTGGLNPSTGNQAVTFTAVVSGGVPDGENVTLEDISNNYAVVSTGVLSGGSATLTVPAGTLLAGTHNLLAVYGGDANFAASESAVYTQTVQAVVTKVQVNGNLASLVGAQRSMVDSIVYSFSEAVNLSGAAATIAVHSGQSGTVPSLIWTAINPNSDGSSTQWAVSFSGSGVVGNSIANGVYNITLNPAAITSDANPSVDVQPRPTDTFYRLFGDVNGDGVVNAADNFQFKTALATYNAAFDYNDDGVVNAADNFQFKASQSYNFSASGIVYTI